MPKYQHIFFDLDRTLYDFDRNNRETILQIFRNLNIDVLAGIDFETFHKAYHKINIPLWERYKNQEITKEYLNVTRFSETLKGFGVNHELGATFASEYIRLSPMQINLLPGAIEVLDYLYEKYPMHIITNGFDEIQYVKIYRCGLEKYFRHIIVSEAAGAQKPNPKIFEYAFEKTGALAQNSILIGDDPDSDVFGAMQMGMDQVWLAQPGEISPYQPTYQIGHLLELKEIL